MSIDEAIAQEKEEAKRLRKIIETGYDGEISIEAIFCDDTDAIKEAYESFENCVKEYEQLAEWLEELKALITWKNDVMEDFCKLDCGSVDEIYLCGQRRGYNKAIDDFANLIKQRKFDYILEFDDFVDRLAEQLKEGVLNE